MSSLKRAKTWELSDSEPEEHTASPAHTLSPGPAEDEDVDDDVGGAGTRSYDPHSKTEGVISVGLVPPPDRGTRAPSVSPGRRRKTAEEKEEEQARVEDRRAERERARVERERKKEKERERVKERRMERERAKAEKERMKEDKRLEQRWRREEAERLKSLKPENCLKSLTIHIHPVLLQDCGCDVLVEMLAGLGWSSCIEQHSLTHSISWTRQLPQGGDEGGGVEVEDQVLMVVTQQEFMAMMISIKQALIGGCEEAESLFQPLSEYLNRVSGVVVSLLVTGAQYCRRKGSWDDDEVCPRSQLGLQDTDIEEVLVYLQLYKNVSVHFLFGWQEVTDHVCSVTKALSKRPFKALCDSTDLGFCLDGSWSGGVRVDASGRGLAQVWTRQIQQLNRVSADMAAAVTSSYPSPALLMQAYEEAESEEEQRKLLANLTVRGGAKERRVGPELSLRVHRLMTSHNPQLVLD